MWTYLILETTNKLTIISSEKSDWCGKEQYCSLKLLTLESLKRKIESKGKIKNNKSSSESSLVSSSL